MELQTPERRIINSCVRAIMSGIVQSSESGTTRYTNSNGASDSIILARTEAAYC